MPEFDLVLRGGHVIDGTGIPRYTADVAIRGARIAEIGRVDAARARRAIDVDGLVVAPGHVDLHTHYDAQIQWDPYCTISGWHGVTTVVLGNCGFGFAPVRPEDRELAMRTMSRTEAIGLDAMRKGLLWDWETIPEWLDTLDRIPKGVNCASYAPTLAILYWVMGVDAAKRRSPNDAERAEIDRLIAEAVGAGACGWSLQRMGPDTAQTDFDGTPMATDTMAEEDLLALGRALARCGTGFIEITQASERRTRENQAVVERLAAAARRPILFNVVQAVNGYPDLHRRQVAWLDDCHRRGLAIYGQGVTVRQPFHVTLEDWNLYDMAPTWNRALQGSRADKMRNLRDPELRRAMVSEYDAKKIPVAVLGGPVEEWVFESYARAASRAQRAEGERSPSDSLEPLLGRRVDEIARYRAQHPIECLFDLSLEDDLRASFLTRSASGDDPQHVAELLASPYVMAGVSDGGAHGKFATGGAYSTDVLEWLVRETGVLSAEQAHRKLAWLPAQAAGMRDRGAVLEGLAADMIVYDAQEIRRAPHWTSASIAHDQPAGEWRRVQKAAGYHWTIVGGQVTFERDRCTGATPGRLLRSNRRSPPRDSKGE